MGPLSPVHSKTGRHCNKCLKKYVLCLSDGNAALSLKIVSSINKPNKSIFISAAQHVGN